MRARSLAGLVFAADGPLIVDEGFLFGRPQPLDAHRLRTAA